jgi:hypothetical protein
VDPERPNTLFDAQPAEDAQSQLTPKPLTGQLARVVNALRQSNRWLSLQELHELTGGDAENSISAQIRNGRKKAAGKLNIIGRRRQGTNGMWEYRLFESGHGNGPEAA